MEDPDISEGDTPNDGAYSLNDKKKKIWVTLGYNTWVLLIWNISGENGCLNPPLWILVFTVLCIWRNIIGYEYIYIIYTRIFIYYLYHGLLVKFSNIYN